MLIRVILISICVGSLNAVIYDLYSGLPTTSAMLALYHQRKNVQYCTISVKPCDPMEWRRIDGTCNNLKYPGRGGYPSVNSRILPPDFSVDYEPRNSKTGEPLPLPRHLRCELLREGKAHELDITLLVPYYILFAVEEVVSTHDIENYIYNTTNCCTPEGKKKYECTPNDIPVDDPIHRYSGVSCQNLTRPQSLQYFGCLDFGTPFVRIIFGTPVFDLSLIYGYKPKSMYNERTFIHGLLKYDTKTFIKTGKKFPIGNHAKTYNKEICIPNQYPRESLCYTYTPNTILGPQLLIVLYYRQHNHIAEELRKMNSCWKDDRLFYTARDINMAIHGQIYFYELLPTIFGKKNMVRDGIISNSKGFRDLYNKEVVLKMADEFTFIHRWFHTIQETTLKLYDKYGYFLNTFPLVNGTFRDGFLPIDNNIDKVLAGSFRQTTGKFDHTIDFDMAERSFGSILFASDVATSDLHKNRLFGFAPYVKYREYCARKPYKKFHHLSDVISKERIHRLREVYENVEDIDLLSGLWSENRMHGGRVPPTLYCLMSTQLKRTLAYDRHWFERPNRPHAFTSLQLKAIRKMTIAGILCSHGDGVTKIQPRAFYSIHKKRNPLMSCMSRHIAKLDVSAWQDPTC